MKKDILELKTHILELEIKLEQLKNKVQTIDGFDKLAETLVKTLIKQTDNMGQMTIDTTTQLNNLKEADNQQSNYIPQLEIVKNIGNSTIRSRVYSCLANSKIKRYYDEHGNMCYDKNEFDKIEFRKYSPRYTNKKRVN